MKNWKTKIVLWLAVLATVLCTGCGSYAMTGPDAAGTPQQGGTAVVPETGSGRTEAAGDEEAGREQPGTEAAGNEEAGTGQPGTEAAGNEQAIAGQPETGAAGNEEAVAGQPGTEAAGNEESGTGQPGKEAAGNEKAVAEQPETEDAAAEDLLDPEGSYTTCEDVALYLETYGELPGNFITKAEARELGWEGGSLEPYAPGMCIGGDKFGNYERILPAAKGRTYRECDIDTLGAKSRGAKRIVYSSDGLIYYTEDHYETFTLLYE